MIKSAWIRNLRKNRGTVPRNVKFEKNTPAKDVVVRFTKALREIMPSATCHACSGKTNNGLVFFKYYSNMESLYQHALNVHDSIIPADSVFNVNVSSDIFRLIEVTPKPHTLTLMLRDKVEEWILRDPKEKEPEKKKKKSSEVKNKSRGGGEDLPILLFTAGMREV
jgi:hypothetical protein